MTYWPLEDAGPDDDGAWIAPSAWTAAADPSLPEGTAEMNGRRFTFAEPELLVRKESAGFLVPLGLLEDMRGMGDISDWLKALRGEIELKPPPPPERHRCLACWLVSLLPGHTRCEHGWLETGCEECWSDR